MMKQCKVKALKNIDEFHGSLPYSFCKGRIYTYVKTQDADEYIVRDDNNSSIKFTKEKMLSIFGFLTSLSDEDFRFQKVKNEGEIWVSLGEINHMIYLGVLSVNNERLAEYTAESKLI